MTLQEIAQEIQHLVDRLTTAREILASLQPDSAFDLPFAQPPPLDATRRVKTTASLGGASVQRAKTNTPSTSADSLPARQRASDAPRQRHRRSAPPSAALTAPVPTGPVAVPAAQVRQRGPQPVKAAVPTPAPATSTSGNSLDDLLREVASRQAAALSR